MDLPAFLQSEEYREAVTREGQFWGEQTETVLQYGIPFRVDYRRRTKIRRPKYQGEYADDPQLFDIVTKKEFNALIAMVVKHAAKNRRVMELACGPGGLALELARHGLQVTGIDISKRSIAIAEKFLAENEFTDTFGSVTYQVADLNLWRAAPGDQYDVICSCGGLHHILDFDNLLKQLDAALPADGRFIFYDNIGETEISKYLGEILAICRQGGGFSVWRAGLDIIRLTAARLRHVFSGKEIADDKGRRAEYLTADSPSPFEGVNTAAILEILPRHFRVEYTYRCQAFVKVIAQHLYILHLNNRYTYPLLYLLKKVDQLLCLTGISSGENVLVVAAKIKAPV